MGGIANSSKPTFFLCLSDKYLKVLDRQECCILTPNPSSTHFRPLANDKVPNSNFYSSIVIKTGTLQANDLVSLSARLRMLNLIGNGKVGLVTVWISDVPAGTAV